MLIFRRNTSYACIGDSRKTANPLFVDWVGVRITRDCVISRALQKEYFRYFRITDENKAPFSCVTKMYHHGSRLHNENYKDFECAFAADSIANLNPNTILDIGS